MKSARGTPALTGAPLVESPPEERALGLLWYMTRAPGCGGRIKGDPDDFVVVERTRWPPEDPAGAFLLLEVRARNWETNRLVGRLARDLHVSRNRVGFAGTKDKRAVSTQGISVKVGPDRTAGYIRLPEVDVVRSFRAARGLALGDLDGNAFEVVVTQIADPDAALARAQVVVGELEERGCPNFFGTQRFGSLRPVTHTVGQAIVDGDYRLAVERYIGTPSAHEEPDVAAFRQAFRDGVAPRELLSRAPARLGFERQMLEALATDPDDPLGAILRLPRNLVLMFVHAHQSEIFNRIVSARMARGLPLSRPVEGDIVVPLDPRRGVREDEPVPVSRANLDKVDLQVSKGRAVVTALVPGSSVPLADGVPGDIEREAMGAAGRTAPDFVLPDLPRYSTSGVRRAMALPIGDLEVGPLDVRGEPSLRLTFSLPRGSYATVVLREVIKRPESAWVATRPGAGADPS
jgi:tRNA pseudouridine13 synthase